MKTFVELVEEIKKSFDQEDNKILSAIEDNIELTSTATLPHAVGTYIVLDKVVYRVTTAIATGDTIEEGVNVTVADDIMTMIAAKQDTLTFDNAPTENSNNPVKSNGIYAANQNIYKVMGQNSAKNFIPFDLDKIKAKNTTGTWNGNVYSLNGIDFTFNSDGTVNASGTATETAGIHYYDPVGLPPFGGDRILRLTGCPSGGGSGTTYKVMAYRVGAVDGSTGTAEDYGDGISLKWLNDGSGVKAFISISVYTGAGTIDVTFKPMLRLASDTDDTYVPYAKSNKELTEDVSKIGQRVYIPLAFNSDYLTDNSTNVATFYLGNGWYLMSFYLGIHFKQGVDLSAIKSSQASLISLPSGYYFREAAMALFRKEGALGVIKMTNRYNSSGLQIYSYDSEQESAIESASGTSFCETLGGTLLIQKV